MTDLHKAVNYVHRPLFSLGFVVKRAQENGGDIKFETYQPLEDSFKNEEIHPADLKAAVEIYMNKLLDPIRKKFEDPVLKSLAEKAYPRPGKQSNIFSRKCIGLTIAFV